MAYYFDEPSRTFNEYLLVPGYSSKECRVENVSLKHQSPNQKRRRTENNDEHSIGFRCHAGCSGEKMAICAGERRRNFFYFGSQPVESRLK